jgi:hypothetical protein
MIMDKNQIGDFNWLPAALGCLLLAAALSAGCAILLSRIARSRGRKRRGSPLNPLLNGIVGIVFFFSLLAAFYTVEDWRGHRAWKQCQRDLEAGGAVLDWGKYTQPPVPDEQNFFKAPKMAEWFNIYHQSPNPTHDVFSGWWQRKHPQVKLADVVVLRPFSASNSEEADEVLNCDSPDPALFKFSTNNFPGFPVQYADVPLTTAIESLTRLAGIRYVLDPKISQVWQGSNEPTVTGRWENVTPADLLFIFMDRYGLQLVPNPDTGVALVTVKVPNTARIRLSPAESDRMKKMLQKVIGTNAIGSDLFPLLATSPSEIKPARIVLRSERMPSDEEIADLFRQSYPNEQKPVASAVSLKHTGPNRVEIMLTADSAAGSLEWYDQFEPDFELLRQALKRPYAQRDGDDVELPKLKLPSFIVVRDEIQLLENRATCHLLLNQPDEAFSDLTLLNDTRRILEARPMTFYSAMMNVAACGAFTFEIAEGLRLGAWKEPQLAALQKQLETIDLFPDITAGLRTEQAICVTFAPGDFHPPDFLLLGRTNLWQKLQYPGFWMFDIAPRGWLDQNRAVAATLYDKQIRSFATPGDVLSPKEIDAAMKGVEAIRRRVSPFTLIARVAGGGYFDRALQAAAANQAKISQAQIACALERYHLARGSYPETLDALSPQFIGKLPRDPIGGRPLHYRRTVDGTFLLYSVGWNEADDGGKTVPSKTGYNPSIEGDWVWNQ